CQPGTNGVRGSMTGHAWSTNSRRLRVASWRSTFARAFGLANQDAKLLEFVICQSVELWCRTDHDRTAIRAAMLVAEVVFVAQEVLGEENVGRRITLLGQCPEAAAQRETSPSFSTFHGFCKCRLALPALDRAHAHAEKGGDLCFSAL